MKKIALYIGSMGGGGAEKVFMLLANSFVCQGFKVDLLLTKKDGFYLNRLDKRINIIELSGKRTLLDLFKLAKYLKSSNPDVIVSALVSSNLICATASLFSRSMTKVYVTEHSNLSQTLNQIVFYKAFVIDLLLRIIYRKVDGVISVSNGVKEDLNLRMPFLINKNVTIYNPFEINSIKEKSLESNSHPWLKSSRNHKTVVAVGRLSAAKDFQNLLTSIFILKDKIDIRLIILGDGELKTELTDFINNKEISGIVSLHGFTDNPFSFMSKADLFVSSSKYEGFSNVLVESMISGCPIVSTDCPSGPAEILENGRWGTLVPVGDPEALADAIYEELSNSTDVSYEQRIKDFNMEKISRSYIKCILNEFS